MAFTAIAVSGCVAQMPTPSLSPSSQASRDPDWSWRDIDAFPPAGASLSAITAGDDGFVVAGSSEAGPGLCPTRRQAQIWISRDGVSWQEAELEGTAGTSVDVLESGLGFGRGVSLTCDESGPVAWKRGEQGWRQLTTAGLEAGDEIVDVVELSSGSLVASGHFGDNDDVMGVWTVELDANGNRSDWHRASEPPPSVRGSTLTALVTNDQVVAGFDVTRNPHAWYSRDGGQTWASSDFDAAYGFLTTSADEGLGGLLAAGRACCGLPDQRYGTQIVSPDGETWTQVRPYAFAKPIEGIVPLDGGWIALGEQTYLTADGTDWRLGPPIRGFESKVHTVNSVPVPYLLAAAASADAIVAITPDHAWVARIADLAAAKWPSPAPSAEMPTVANSYEVTLATHCGPYNGPLLFDGRSWIPELPNGAFPLGFDYYYETGTLKFVADDTLEFTGAKGDVITYRPTDGPPHGAPCH